MEEKGFLRTAIHALHNRLVDSPMPCSAVPPSLFPDYKTEKCKSDDSCCVLKSVMHYTLSARIP